VRIGVDLDNTIINYDDAFAAGARRLGIDVDGAHGKAAIRAAVRALPEGEMQWQRLQAQAYGEGIEAAVAFAGFDAFLARCAERSVPVWIVSHKTRVAAADPLVDLRAAASAWLDRRGYVAAGGPVQGVYFEATRAEKIARIRALACTHFIDDLSEVFFEPAFPTDVQAFLFGGEARETAPGVRHVPDWPAATAAIFGDDRG